MPGKFEIIRAVKEGLDRLETEIDTGALDREYTEAIETVLCEIGRDSFRCQVYAKDVPENKKDGGEWLYDVTWLEYEKNGRGELTDALLVAECEWGGEQEIEYDFEKLLLARAGVRVMIFHGGVDPGARSDLLAGKVKAFNGSSTEDAWLLVAWERNGDGWRFRYFTIGSEPSAIEC